VSERLARLFPLLHAARFAVTSPEQVDYNCVAWAAGETTRWWWPDEFGQYYWPEEAPRRSTLEAFGAAFRRLGFEECEHADFEPGWEKVAIYAKEDGSPSHAARQLPDGAWTSKLGALEDVKHTSLEQLTGDAYGWPVLFLRRWQRGRAAFPDEASP